MTIRIVTTTSTPARVGPRASQWAYSRQPFAADGLHTQVRSDDGYVTVEAVRLNDGMVVAAGANIVELEGRVALWRRAALTRAA